MVKVTLVTWPPIVACAAPELTALLTVAIFNVLSGAKGLAVVNCPAANVILCAPADNTAVAVVHTIVSVPAVIAQGADSVVTVAEPDAGTSTPTGFVLALK